MMTSNYAVTVTAEEESRILIMSEDEIRDTYPHWGGKRMLTARDGSTVEIEPLISKLADAFVADLKANVSPADFAEIRRRNATPEYARACASHDFVDANECMTAAFNIVIGRDANPASDADTALWNAAWDLAKARSLTSTN